MITRQILKTTAASALAIAGAASLWCGLVPGAASAAGTAPSVIHAQTLLIDEADRDAYGIKKIRWVEASGSIPAHAFIVGCHACGPASYTSAGELENPSSLPSIPTSYILHVPENYDARLFAYIPPGVSTQTFFRARHGQLLGDGYAVAVMNHPRPGFPGFPYEQFFRAPFSTADYGHGYAATGHVLRDLLAESFAAPEYAYALGESRGALAGAGLLADRPDRPFDGYVLRSGGNGHLGDLKAFTQSYLTDGKVPLTGLANPVAGLSTEQFEAAFAGSIGIADPEHRAMVLSGDASALDYDVSTRPRSVQRSWSHLEYGAEIAVPVILIQGLRDTTIWPSETLQHAQRIIDAGRGHRLRLYLIKEMGHNPPNPPAAPEALYVNSVRTLDAWVSAGVEPGPIDAGTMGTHTSCDARGYATDPLACFGEVFGTGF